MIEEIFPDLYKIEIPLPESPLRAINSYLIKGAERSLIVDTGMNRAECRRVLLSSLEKLGVDLKMTDFFITHLHTDHLGLVADLADKSAKVYFNYIEASMLDFRKHWEESSAFYRVNAFPAEEIKKALEGHPGFKYNMSEMVHFSTVKDGDTIEVGKYRFHCIETPGHSAGHTCLYEASKKILVSGDHILLDITPNVSLWLPERNVLKQYLASLDKIYLLDVNLVLPGHGRPFNNLRQRIIELKQHHRERADEILSILNSKVMNAYQISSRMSCDIEYGSWEEFPASQKWFAMGETLSHLKYLEDEGSVHSEMQGGNIVYSVA